MSGPWEKYQPASDGPWSKYATETADAPDEKLTGIRGEAYDKAMNYKGGKDVMGGLTRGAGSIGATVMRLLPNAMGGDTASENEQRRTAMDDALRTLGANPDSMGFKTNKLVAEIAGTSGIGGVVGNALEKVPFIASKAPALIDAIKTYGMSANGAQGLGGVAARMGGGAITGGLSAGAVNPEDAGTGALIGAITPAVLQLAGKFGSAVYNAVKSGQRGSGKMLADAMGVSEAELPAIIKALNDAPDALVPGSRLTVNQALQQRGQKVPGAQMLERIVAGGPGGDTLLKRYADQGAARLAALEDQGAKIYQGAARTEASLTGDKIGAILRTQKGDDKAAARKVWEALDNRATSEGVALQLPLDAMKKAMRPLGAGTVGAGGDARSVLQTATDIGTDLLPAIKAMPKSSANAQTLEQAVRSLGGVKPGDYLSKEISELGRKQSGTTGLVSKMGKDVESLAELMYQRGYLPDSDAATLLDMLRNNGGRNVYANDIVDNAFQRQAEAAMGDLPGAERIAKAIPFEDFQRLRSSAGELAAKASGQGGSKTEAGVLNSFKSILEGRVDDAAAGNLLPGENMSQGFKSEYNKARGLTRDMYARYSGGNNIESILRKPVGQDYSLTGDEITNKLWHGGAGLGGDVSNLKKVLSDTNREPTLDALRRFIMTDAASKTTASGDLAAALPRYVETRMPGLLEAMTDDQLKALTSVSGDIKNAAAASNVKGLLGSDTEAKVARALDGGLLDSNTAKTVSKLLSVKGIGLDTLRGKAAESYVAYKGKTIAQLLANPKDAAKALNDAGFVKRLDSETLKNLRLAIARSAPLLATD